MKKMLRNILYIIGIILLIPFIIAILWVLYDNAREYFLIAAVIGVLVIFTPILIKHGLKTVRKERDNVYAQLRYNMPVRYNTGKIFIGFIEILGVFWLIIPCTFLIPGEMWIMILPLLSIATWIVECCVSAIWSDIGWKKSKYWLMNISVYIFGVVVGYIVSQLIYS